MEYNINKTSAWAQMILDICHFIIGRHGSNRQALELLGTLWNCSKTTPSKQR